MPSPLTTLLDENARTLPGAEAVIFSDERLTFAQLRNATLLAACRLRGAGVGTGDRVGILRREASPTYLIHALAAMRLGAICVPVNARNKVRELAQVVTHSGMRLLLTDGDFVGLVEEAVGIDGPRVVRLDDPGDFATAGEGVSEADVDGLAAGVGPDVPALLLYTSGTTSDPKGCLHTHGTQVFLSAMRQRSCFVHPGAFEATVALDQLEREGCTVAMPAFELLWMAVLDHPRFQQADLSALRLTMNVGVPERLAMMQERTPQAIQVSCLGMTEAAGSICIGSPDDPLRSRTETSGRPLDGTEVRVVDPVDGSDQPAGVAGELQFRGPSRFVGYFEDLATTARTIDAEGWFRTGDLVVRHEDGTLTFVNRLKDMLKVGGENVAAAEIEGYLITHPAVAVAAVVAAPDARYGEVPAAFVQLREHAEAVDEQALIDYCLGQIATFKVPRYVRIVSDFPLTPTAKIQKFILRDQIVKELGDRGVTEAPRLIAH